MPKITTNRKIGVFAISNAGKTYLVYKLIGFLCGRGERVIMYDTDHMDKNKFAFSKIKGCSVFDPAIGKENNPNYFNKFLMVVKSQYSNCWLFVDDIDSFFDEHGQNAFEFGELKSLASKGRHQRMGFIYASKMASFLPSQLIQNTNLFYIGTFPTEKSIKPIEKIVSFDEVHALSFEKHEFLEIDADNNFKKRVVIA